MYGTASPNDYNDGSGDVYAPGAISPEDLAVDNAAAATQGATATWLPTNYINPAAPLAPPTVTGGANAAITDITSFSSESLNLSFSQMQRGSAGCTDGVGYALIVIDYMATTFGPTAGSDEGCWSYDTPSQEPDSPFFETCISNANNPGGATSLRYVGDASDDSDVIFDDTNGTEGEQTEENLLGQCGNYAAQHNESVDFEWMAAGPSGQPDWLPVANNSDGHHVDPQAYIAELYNSTTDLATVGNIALAEQLGYWPGINLTSVVNSADAGGGTAGIVQAITFDNCYDATQNLAIYIDPTRPLSPAASSAIVQGLNDCFPRT